MFTILETQTYAQVQESISRLLFFGPGYCELSSWRTQKSGHTWPVRIWKRSRSWRFHIRPWMGLLRRQPRFQFKQITRAPKTDGMVLHSCNLVFGIRVEFGSFLQYIPTSQSTVGRLAFTDRVTVVKDRIQMTCKGNGTCEKELVSIE